jgi:hypothetical protein
MERSSGAATRPTGGGSLGGRGLGTVGWGRNRTGADAQVGSREGGHGLDAEEADSGGAESRAKGSWLLVSSERSPMSWLWL